MHTQSSLGENLNLKDYTNSQYLWIFLLESTSTISSEQAAQEKLLDFAGINLRFASLIFLVSVLSNNRDAERDGEF